MKKIVILVVVLVVCGIGCFSYKKYLDSLVPKMVVEEEKGIVSNYIVYGNYFNMEGEISFSETGYEKLELVLYEFSSGEEVNYDILTSVNDNVVSFHISDYINDGLYLDDVLRGEYGLFLKATYLETLEKTDEVEEVSKYYVLLNGSSYEDTIYYTMAKVGNKIVIDSDNEFATMMFTVTSNGDNDAVYDIVIDPGHGGIDGGATVDSYREADLTMAIASLAKEKLEELGLKVKLTREEDSLGRGEYFSEYDAGGRAVISHEVYAKNVLSLHMNSNTATYVSGMELYTADLIEYDFAKLLISNMTSLSGMKVSSNRINKIVDGIYTHNFSEDEIVSNNSKHESLGYTLYNITTKSNYLYMIRETGGIMTGAYVADLNEEVGYNPYFDSNIGAEAYLLELGYMTNSSDLDILVTKQEEIAQAIANSFGEKYNLLNFED